MPGIIDDWKQEAHRLEHEIHAIYLAYKDPRTPLYAKIFAACVIGYAFSPIDLIPDTIPILGYLDDLILIPLGIAILIKMIPPKILQECREKAQVTQRVGKQKSWIAGSIIIAIWIIAFLITIVFTRRFFQD